MKRALFLFTLAMLTACSGEQVPTEIVDQNQIITRENARKNANLFAKERFGGKVEQTLVESDSSVSSDCRFGDGWASGKIILNTDQYVDIKCQTNGRGKGLHGCLLKDDFVKKPYSGEEGSCNTSLTKLEKFQ